MEYRNFAATVLALTTAAASGVAQTAARGPMSMEVAGVRLGTPQPQAKAALAKSYGCSDSVTALTFEQKVSDEVKKRRTGNDGRWGGGEGTDSLDCVGPGGEQLIVWMAHTAAGPVVREMRLNLSNKLFAADQVYTQILTRYGRPSVSGDRTSAAWCEAGDPCRANTIMAKGPMLVANKGAYGVTIHAVRGDRAKDADAAAVQAAADRIAPKKSGATF